MTNSEPLTAEELQALRRRFADTSDTAFWRHPADDFALFRRLLATLDAAVENERRRLYEAVEEPDMPTYTPERSERGDHDYGLGSPAWVPRATVLALLAPPAEKEQT